MKYIRYIVKYLEDNILEEIKLKNNRKKVIIALDIVIYLLIALVIILAIYSELKD